MNSLLCKLTGGHKWEDAYAWLIDVYTNEAKVMRVCKKCGYLETIFTYKRGMVRQDGRR